MNGINFTSRDATTAIAREDRAVFRRTFDGRSGVDFSALNDALAFLACRGFSVGPGCQDAQGADRPHGVMFGTWKIAKWHGLTPEEQARLHGTLTGPRRRGPVRVAIFWNAPAFAIAAVATPHVGDRIITQWTTQR